MPYRTRPIKVAEGLPAQATPPLKLNLLKAGFVPVATPVDDAPASARSPVAGASRRPVELVRKKIDLIERIAPNGDVDLSDMLPAKSATHPPLGLASVREVPEAHHFKQDKTGDTLAIADPPRPEASTGQNGSPPQSPALSRVVESWPQLSPCIQAAILAMVEAVAAGLEQE